MNRACCFPKEDHQNSQTMGEKFMNFSVLALSLVWFAGPTPDPKTVSKHFPETLRRLAGLSPRRSWDFLGFRGLRPRETFSRPFLGNVSETPTPTICLKSTAVHLQFVRQYAPHLYRSTFLSSKLRRKGNPAIRLPFVLQYASHLYGSTPPHLYGSAFGKCWGLGSPERFWLFGIWGPEGPGAGSQEKIESSKKRGCITANNSHSADPKAVTVTKRFVASKEKQHQSLHCTN